MEPNLSGNLGQKQPKGSSGFGQAKADLSGRAVAAIKEHRFIHFESGTPDAITSPSRRGLDKCNWGLEYRDQFDGVRIHGSFARKEVKSVDDDRSQACQEENRNAFEFR